MLSLPTILSTKNLKIYESHTVDRRHFKIEKLQYLQNHSANFDEILHTDTLCRQTTQIFEIFKNARWWMAPLWKSLNAIYLQLSDRFW